MGIPEKIRSLKKIKKTIVKHCEVCKMEYTVKAIPILADRKAKEFDRQHGVEGHSKKGGKMGLIEFIIIILLILWAFGGLLALPVGGGILNLLLVIVVIWIIYELIQGRR